MRNSHSPNVPCGAEKVPPFNESMGYDHLRCLPSCHHRIFQSIHQTTSALPVKMAGSLLATSTSCHRKGTCEKPLKVPWFLETWVWHQFRKLLLLNFLESKQVTRNLPKIHQEFMLDPVSMISWIIWKSNHLKTYPLNPPKLNESSQLRQSFQRLRYVWRLPRCCWLHSSTFGIRYQTHSLWNIWCKTNITHTHNKKLSLTTQSLGLEVELLRMCMLVRNRVPTWSIYVLPKCMLIELKDVLLCLSVSRSKAVKDTL